MLPLVLAGASAIAAGLLSATRGNRSVPKVSGSPDLPIPVTLTSYFPYLPPTVPAAQRLMEGPPVDHYGRPLHTLQQHLRDPARHPFASLSGDLMTAANPRGRFLYGQRLVIPSVSVPAIFRLVDTGSHFHGPIFDATDGRPVPKFTKDNPHKVIRFRAPDGQYAEPIDVAMDVGTGFGILRGWMVAVASDVLDPRTGRPV